MPRTQENIDVSRRETEFFDSLVEQIGDFNPFTQRAWNTLRKRFAQMAANGTALSSMNILDVGCGTGQSFQIYADYAKSFTGVDLSERERDKARTRFPLARWIHADACDLPFSPDTFDAVCFSGVLHHIPDFAPAIREAHRVLRRGGKAFAYDPNLRHPAMALFRWPKSPLYNPKGVSPNERPLLPRVLRRAFLEAGFQNVRQRCQGDLPYREVAPKLINACLSMYNAGEWVMARMQLDRIFGTLTLTVAEKL